MSEILCKKHGMVSPKFVSPNVAKNISSNHFAELKITSLILHLPFGKKGVFDVDQEFIDQHGGSHEVFDEEEAFDIYDKLKAICPQCYHEKTNKRPSPAGKES